MSLNKHISKNEENGTGLRNAIVGAVSAIIVGYLGYLGVIHKTVPDTVTSSTFTFAGQVTGDDGKGLPNARVSVTEDQNTAQTMPTDQYGNFDVQLSQKTQSLVIRVDAGENYDVVTVDANPRRTGPEIISVHRRNYGVSKQELTRAVTEFEQRLSDMEQYEKQLASLSNAPPDSRQVPSIYIWRIWYGDHEYQNAEPEYKNVRWKGVLAKIRELGVTEKYELADRAITEIEEGDIPGKHYTAKYLEPRIQVLRDYTDTVLEPAIK